MELVKVLAIIVTYKGIQWYDRCLGSLRKSSIPVDIFVVDNASCDGTVNYLKTNFPEIILIESDVNLGFGQANNKGMRYALDNGYDYVFLLNQDAWIVQPNTIEELIRVNKKYPEYIIINPTHLYADEKRINSMKRHFLDVDNRNNDIISDLVFNRDLKEVYEVKDIGATAWIMPIDLLKNIGGFDPLFFHYGEDDNYIQRIKYHYPNSKMGMSLLVSIVHDVEFRDDDYGKENNNWKKDLLVELSDINKNINIRNRKINTLSKVFRQIISFRLSLAKFNFNLFQFIAGKEKAIKTSCNTNKKIGSNWL